LPGPPIAQKPLTNSERGNQRRKEPSPRRGGTDIGLAHRLIAHRGPPRGDGWVDPNLKIRPHDKRNVGLVCRKKGRKEAEERGSACHYQRTRFVKFHLRFNSPPSKNIRLPYGRNTRSQPLACSTNFRVSREGFPYALCQFPETASHLISHFGESAISFSLSCAYTMTKRAALLWGTSKTSLRLSRTGP
jgi:hypothetical protein